MISPHKNQIEYSTLEQSDFRTSIICFLFPLPFLSIFLSLFSCNFSRLFLVFILSFSCQNHPDMGHGTQVQHPLFIGKKGRHHGMPTLGISYPLHAPIHFLHENQGVMVWNKKSFIYRVLFLYIKNLNAIIWHVIIKSNGRRKMFGANKSHALSPSLP